MKRGILTKCNEFSFPGINPFEGPVYKMQLCFKICVTEITAAVYRWKFSRFVAVCGNDTHTRARAFKITLSAVEVVLSGSG